MGIFDWNVVGRAFLCAVIRFIEIIASVGREKQRVDRKDLGAVYDQFDLIEIASFP